MEVPWTQGPRASFQAGPKAVLRAIEGSLLQCYGTSDSEKGRCQFTYRGGPCPRAEGVRQGHYIFG